MTPDSHVRSRTFVRRERALAAAICAILAGSFVLNLALFLTARSGVDIVWSHDARFLRSVQGADSWKAMETARAYARTHSSDLYEQVFFVDAVKFQYPPTALLLFGNLERPALNRISSLGSEQAARSMREVSGCAGHSRASVLRFERRTAHSGSCSAFSAI